MNLKDLERRPTLIHRIAWYTVFSVAIASTLTALILALWVNTLLRTNAELGYHAAYTIDSLRAEVVVHELTEAAFWEALNTSGSREAGALLRADK